MRARAVSLFAAAVMVACTSGSGVQDSASRASHAPAAGATDRTRLAVEATAPSTTSARPLVSARASRSKTTARPRVAVPRPAPRPAVVSTPDAAFWRRLANCESSDGTGGNGGGYFQFSPDTARKVGYHAGLSYEAQVGLAQKWLGMIGGRGGSRSGWPVCWWKAGGQ